MGETPFKIADTTEIRSGAVANNEYLRLVNGEVVGGTPSAGGTQVHRISMQSEITTDGTDWFSWSDAQGWSGDTNWDTSFGAQSGDPSWGAGDISVGIHIAQAITLTRVTCTWIQAGNAITRLFQLRGRTFTSGSEAAASVLYASGSDSANDNLDAIRLDLTLSTPNVPANTFLRIFCAHSGFAGAYDAAANFEIEYQDQ